MSATFRIKKTDGKATPEESHGGIIPGTQARVKFKKPPELSPDEKLTEQEHAVAYERGVQEAMRKLHLRLVDTFQVFSAEADTVTAAALRVTKWGKDFSLENASEVHAQMLRERKLHRSAFRTADEERNLS